jgi:serine/threonine protein kinase
MQQPSKFGKYVLLERISVGGMAEVFKAKYSGVEGFQKILAIKRILPSLTEDVDFIRMFIDEAKIAGQLNHANICQIYELGRINKSHFIAMEYIWGKDLLQISTRYRKANKTMHFGQACYILSKACEALDYAHKKKDAHGRPMGIIHRDVTPQNILVSYEGEVKLIDFGIAKARDRSAKTAAGVLKGKFGYMSPEQVRGLPLDRRSDIFSLGIVLWEVATGQRLFDGQTDFVVLEKVRNVQVPPPSSINPRVPRRLEAIIMKALQKDPDDRFQWANEMHKALQSFMMTQKPMYSAKLMASWMTKTFAKEIHRERATLERYFKSDGGQGKPAATSPRRRHPSMPQRPAPQPQAAQRRPAPKAAPPPAPAEDDEEDATVIDDEGRFGPLEPVLDEPSEPAQAAAPSPPPAAQEEDLGEESTVMLDEGENPMEQLSAQSTVMLDEDDDNRPDMQKVLDQIAESKQPAQAGQQQQPSPAAAAQDGGAPEPASSPGGMEQPSSIPDPSAIPETSGPVATPAPAAIPPAKPGAPAKKRTLVRDLLVGVPVAVVCFALGALVMKMTASPPPKQPTKGSLVVNVVPIADAQVSINGKEKSAVTGGELAKFEGVPHGSHVLRVEAAGYKPAELQVKVAEGVVTTKTVSLEKKQQPSKLSLEIRPPEASPIVKLDGKKLASQELAKPIELPMNEPVELEVLAFGYERFQKKIEGSTDKEIPLKVELQKASQPMVQIDSKPAGASVLLGDEEKCITPCRVSNLPTRKQLRIDVAKPGYKAQSWKLRFRKGDPGKELLVTLEPEQGKEPPSRVSEARPPQREPDRPSRPAARRPASHRQARKTRPRPPRADTPPARPRPRPREKKCDSRCPHKNKGCLWANSQPRSRVYVDGRNTGRNTPIAGGRALKLRPGYHRITFVTPDGKKHKYGVRIKACQVSRLVRRLK